MGRRIAGEQLLLRMASIYWASTFQQETNRWFLLTGHPKKDPVNLGYPSAFKLHLVEFGPWFKLCPVFEIDQVWVIFESEQLVASWQSGAGNMEPPTTCKRCAVRFEPKYSHFGPKNVPTMCNTKDGRTNTGNPDRSVLKPWRHRASLETMGFSAFETTELTDMEKIPWQPWHRIYSIWIKKKHLQKLPNIFNNALPTNFSSNLRGVHAPCAPVAPPAGFGLPNSVAVPPSITNGAKLAQLSARHSLVFGCRNL